MMMMMMMIKPGGPFNADKIAGNIPCGSLNVAGSLNLLNCPNG